MLDRALDILYDVQGVTKVIVDIGQVVINLKCFLVVFDSLLTLLCVIVSVTQTNQCL